MLSVTLSLHSKLALTTHHAAAGNLSFVFQKVVLQLKFIVSALPTKPVLVL